MEDLAVFGGMPFFKDPLHVGQPNIGDRQRLLSRFEDLLDRRMLSNNGPYVREFEALISEYVGVEYAIAVCNATIGLEIVIRALGLQGEVLLPSFTFAASAHALQWSGVQPVFCDVNRHTHQLDPMRLEHRIGARTSAIMGVHLWGLACTPDVLTEIAERNSLELFFDAAHAFGCTHKGRMIGGFGRAEVFSFHATKFVNSFEGGVITTNSPELAGKIQAMRNFGFGLDRESKTFGINAKMSEISAAMGITSLESMPVFVARNHMNYECYHAVFDTIPGVSILRFPEDEEHNYQYIVAEIDEQAAGVSRDQFFAMLQAENVLAKRYFAPGCHQLEPYRTQNPHVDCKLPDTMYLSERVLVLPTGTQVYGEEIEGIGHLMRFCIENNGLFQLRMAER